MTFTNELGNAISMSVTRDGDSVTVLASGPTSETDHVWTLLEARELHNLLGKVLA